MAITTTVYTDITDEELAEFFTNRRIKADHFRDLNRNTNYMYVRTYNKIAGHVWKGGADYFRPGSGTFKQSNIISAVGLDEISDQILPTIESKDPFHFISVKAFGVNVALRVHVGGTTATANTPNHPTTPPAAGWARSGAAIAVVTAPTEVYLDAKALQTDTEDGTDRLYAFEVIETILSSSQVPQ